MGIFKAPHLERIFPKLKDDDYDVTSPYTTGYNCIAHALDRNDVKYWPRGEPKGYTWPDGVPKAATIRAFEKLFQSRGYQMCKDGSYEEGFEKVALYADEHDVPTHAAKQIGLDSWTSKLGNCEDIQHCSLEAIGGNTPAYGKVVRFLKRKVKTPDSQVAITTPNLAKSQSSPPHGAGAL